MNFKILAIISYALFARFLGNSAESLEGLDFFQNTEGLNTSEYPYGTEIPKITQRRASPRSELPADLFTKEQLRNGAVILYFVGAMYSFGVIGIVCGDYFLPSVDCICTDLNLSQDVAAATFMSFATTAPELFIIIIATFISNSDSGVGTVVGGGMFNILGVATIGGLAARTPIKLDWWPLYRDSIVYMLAPIGLSLIVSDGTVTLIEALCLIFYYFFYFLIMFFNRSIRSRIKAWVKRFIKKKIKNDESSTSIPADKPTPIVPTISLTLDLLKTNEIVAPQEDFEDNDDSSFKAYFMNYEDTISLRRTSACSNASNRSNRSRKRSDRSLTTKRPSIQTASPANQTKLLSVVNLEDENLHFVSSNQPDHLDRKKVKDPNDVVSDFDVTPKVTHDPIPMSLFTLPEGTLWNKFTWLVLWPSSFFLNYTIPDCRSETWRRFYPLTFLMCVFWIGVSSYFGNWMISVVGKTMEMPESVMGLTFLALGGSMPEAISTFIMSRQGEGGLGFSNSLGGNTMDICLCLGLPWLIKCAIEGPIQIKSDGLQYNSCALVVGIIILLSIVTHTRFYMNKKLGFVCCIFYFIFISISVLIEMDIIEPNKER